MKLKKIFVAAVVLLSVVQIFCVGCGNTKTEDKPLRIHVRADSDSAAAQAVKCEVASAIDYYLSCELENVNGYDEMINTVRCRLAAIEQIAAAVLRSKGYGYGACATLTHDYFAERKCGDRLVPAGEYDALIVKLGSGGGDNWWGIIYPRSGAGGSGVRYKSLIADLLHRG